LEEIPTTEQWLHIEALEKQASGDGRPEKLSLLRQKLSQKAKQDRNVLKLIRIGRARRGFLRFGF
jgi:hypothetical protein